MTAPFGSGTSCAVTRRGSSEVSAHRFSGIHWAWALWPYLMFCVCVQVTVLMWSVWTGIPPKAWWCRAARTASSRLSSGTQRRDKVWPRCEITDRASWLIYYHGNQWLTRISLFSHAHKNTVMEVKWNLNGNWLLTASRDHLCKLFDIRNLKEELQVFRGHKKEATGEIPDSKTRQ